MGGHLGFTFHWPVSIPDMEIEFTGPDRVHWAWSTTYQSLSLHTAFLSDRNPWIDTYIYTNKHRVFHPSHHVCKRAPRTSRLVPSHRASRGGQGDYSKTAKIFIPSHHACKRAPRTSKLVPSHRAWCGGRGGCKCNNSNQLHILEVLSIKQN